jgi:hypothetical protein
MCLKLQNNSTVVDEEVQKPYTHLLIPKHYNAFEVTNNSTVVDEEKT